jgi:LPXTG-motif cell wall-anchored protein
VFPSTGSSGWDVILEIALVLALVATLVLLIRNFRDR